MSVIDEIKARIDIVDLIGQHVPLKKAGRSFSALCPFHTEKTPSFSVSPERQTWHCFGACSAGGDIFTFVMRREGVEFGEALRLLADRAGVTLVGRAEPEEDAWRQRLLQANEAAAAYYHHVLLHTPAAEAARSYLAARGLDGETIEAFQLGCSLDSWDALRLHLSERGFAEQELLAAGLLVESERGGYDRFRGRLMFPIRDERGRVAGFGARRLEAAAGGTTDPSPAKYINTAQTVVFDKGSLLYGLDRAKEAIRQQKSAVVVEGYLDVIAAHQHGIANVVASMGTALTERQVRLLERLRAKVLLALDADAAGMEATLRALQEGQAAGAARAASASAHPEAVGEKEFSERVQEWSRDALKRAAVNFFVVPLSGKDPDEVIRNDRARWDAAVAEARPFTDHLFDTVASRRDLSQLRERSELLRELLPVVRLIEEPVFRAHYVQRLARLAQVAEGVVRGELQRRPARVARRDAPVAATGTPARRAPGEPGEEFSLALLLRYPELRSAGLALAPDLFLLEEHRALFAAWRETLDLESIRQALPGELHPILDDISKRNVPFLEGTELLRAFEDCVRRIQFRRLSAAKQAGLAALTDPDVRADLGAAVDEAHALWEGAAASALAAPDDTPVGQLARVLLQDMKTGRALHQSAQREPAPARHESSPDEETP